jgi:hypothetical protein
MAAHLETPAGAHLPPLLLSLTSLPVAGRQGHANASALTHFASGTREVASPKGWRGSGERRGSPAGVIADVVLGLGSVR